MGIAKRITIIKRAVYTAVFTALVFAATVLIVVSTPATRGFFNLGETMVYTTAIITMDPAISFIAGGLGSALADLYLGCSHYAPGTFIIKSIEGLLVVLLIRILFRLKRYWKPVLLLMDTLASALILVYGVFIYSGETVVEIYGRSITINIPIYFWVAIASILWIVILLIGLRIDPMTGFKALAVIIAGLEMVTGYFLYQVFYLGYGVQVAAVEIPINMGQALIGLAIALPLSRTLLSMGIGLAEGSGRD